MSDHAAHGPLVAFTTLAIAGAGLVAASAYFEVAHGLRLPHLLAAGALLLAAGLAVSLRHLGRSAGPARGARAPAERLRTRRCSHGLALPRRRWRRAWTSAGRMRRP